MFRSSAQAQKKVKPVEKTNSHICYRFYRTITARYLQWASIRYLNQLAFSQRMYLNGLRHYARVALLQPGKGQGQDHLLLADSQNHYRTHPVKVTCMLVCGLGMKLVHCFVWNLFTCSLLEKFNDRYFCMFIYRWIICFPLVHPAIVIFTWSYTWNVYRPVINMEYYKASKVWCFPYPAGCEIYQVITQCRIL